MRTRSSRKTGSRRPPSRWLRPSAGRSGTTPSRRAGPGSAAAVACTAFLAACSAGDTPSPPAQGEGPASLLPSAAPAGDCAENGHLALELVGALNGEFEWQGGKLSCEGMSRPASRGARLRFAGAPGNGLESIAVIIAIPDLERGETAAELPSNVTLIEEGHGRFFSTPDLAQCWTDVERQARTDEDGDTYDIAGAVYCIGPLGEVNGSSSVSIEQLRFRGLVDWSAT